MKCPQCKKDSKVTDTRLRGSNRIKRRRKCNGCGHSFITTEVVGDVANDAPLFPLLVIKKSGKTEAYSRQKLVDSISVALRKTQRADIRLEDVADGIEEQIRTRAEMEEFIETRTIGEKIMAILRHHDTIAYLRYASVHLEMNSPDDFRQLLDRLTEPLPTNDE